VAHEFSSIKSHISELKSDNLTHYSSCIIPNAMPRANQPPKESMLLEALSLPRIAEDKIPKLIDSTSYNELEIKPISNPIPVENSGLEQKIAKLAGQIEEVMKSLCANCSLQLIYAKNEKASNLCNICNNIFCNSCLKACKCFKCGKKVCDSHCVKCHLCNKRTCKEKLCISDFRICQLCERTFCQDHFETHRKFNALDTYNKIRCITEKCKLTQPIGSKNMEDFMKIIIHACSIKELRLRTIII
jgi:hypothetical protein